MFLSAYHFDGDGPALLAAYERLMARMPADAIDLHVCVLREGGVTLFDACPSRAAFEEFSQGGEFRAALAAAGLPAPRIEPLGEVHRAVRREGVHP